MARQHVEVGIVMEDRHPGANGDGANETTDQSAHGLPTTEPKQSGCIVIVHRPRREKGRPREQSAEVMQMLFVAPTSQHFTALQIAVSLSSSASTRSQVAEPVSRRNSIHADVSIRITPSDCPATR